MNTSKYYPKAKAFFDKHPGITPRDAIKILDYEIREIDKKLGGNNNNAIIDNWQ